MNEILIDWGVDPKLANMFDETIIAVLMIGVSIGLDYLCQAIFVEGVAEKFSKIFSFKSEKFSQLVSRETFKEFFQNSFVQIEKFFPVD